MNKDFNHKPPSRVTEASRLVETIYRNAVEKCISSSSEEDGINISDETFGFIADDNAHFQPDYEDVSMETEEIEHNSQESVTDRMARACDLVAPDPSYAPVEMPDLRQLPLSAEEKAEKLVIEAENVKARMFPNNTGNMVNPLHFTAKINEDYLVVGAHIDEGMKAKIIKGDYVDFVKLLPWDHILAEEDGRMELIVRNRKTFWMPVTESVSINGFS